MFHKIPSSFIYYVSGIFVAISVNLITLVNSDNSKDIYPILLAFIWFVSSLFLTLLAITLESTEFDYQNKSTDKLSSEEKLEVKKIIYSKKGRIMAVYSFFVLVFLLLGVYISIFGMSCFEPFEFINSIEAINFSEYSESK